MKLPKKMFVILDAFCKAGGCSVGYARACEKLGIPYEIIGIDVQFQKNYPYTFIQGDAIEFIRKHGHKFDFIHASPPCQAYSRSTAYMKLKGKVYPELVPEVRRLMSISKKAGIIENVIKRAVRSDLLLRGDFFGLKVIRVRHFETINCMVLQPQFGKVNGQVKKGNYVCVYGKPSWKNCGHGSNTATVIPDWRKESILKTWQFAMGIDWMTADEIREAIPPAYTEFIGMQIFENLYSRKVK